MHSQNYYNISS